MLRRSAVLLTSLACLLGGEAASPGAATTPATLGAEAGSPGIGDPYFPLDGNGGIDVRRYSVHDRYAFGRKRLSGWTRLKVRATQDLLTFNLDLLLDPSRVTVDGDRVRFRKTNVHELRVRPDRPIRAGTTFTVGVRYAGHPARLRYRGERNWLANAHEVVTMNEPHMAPWWYPANDHPLDKARHDFHITVARGKRVIANGLPDGSRRHGDLVTWHWSAPDPMAPYLAFFAAGDFRMSRSKHGGLPSIVAASERLPGNGTKVALTWLKKTPRLTRWLRSELGDYPFVSTGGLVTSLNPGFALENQTRPTYPYVGASATWLLVHELAHQWFGDSVSVQTWRDIWLNEGFATYMEVRYAETHGGPSGASWLRRTYQQYPAGDSFWRVSLADPGAGKIFDGAVYDRGAMTLQALRNLIGNQGFARLLRTWVAQRRYGNAATADFHALAEQVSGRDLDAFFDAWLVGTTKPADTAANGLG
jgi:aminopeptidase N